MPRRGSTRPIATAALCSLAAAVVVLAGAEKGEGALPGKPGRVAFGGYDGATTGFAVMAPSGGAGRDVLRGGPGRDQLRGGPSRGLQTQ